MAYQYYISLNIINKKNNNIKKGKAKNGKIFYGPNLLFLIFFYFYQWSGNQYELHKYCISKIYAYPNLQTAFYWEKSQCCSTQG